ncbi:hypothetical protein [Clostridium saccharoperbutylacetonicum]|uniref:hypothetical protein n=1 Tax=Clostridium saccharoperbutylacetonicum TaxID=36745 RepID=UPI00098403A5|nr:hypothetical protein [Clostridium saccharoperbutylacetonicum]AQR96839.1 hypothetical protein CLSAP_41630 [Clostridium saccharoperbutylacetonicum]NSB32717.1 hypothetical protein [Clostridium saccharoperbutylacetonicum]
MKSKQIAENGLTVALTLVILYATSILPISTLSILTVASCLIPISIIRTSIRNTFLVYLASSIISFFLVPTNIALYYALFFGVYGIIKYFAEKIRNRPLEIALKLLGFNILLLIIYWVTINFLGLPTINYPLYLLWALAQIVFLIYDYALTIIISFYLNRIHKHI